MNEIMLMGVGLLLMAQGGNQALEVKLVVKAVVPGCEETDITVEVSLRAFGSVCTPGDPACSSTSGISDLVIGQLDFSHNPDAQITAFRFEPDFCRGGYVCMETGMPLKPRFEYTFPDGAEPMDLPVNFIKIGEFDATLQVGNVTLDAINTDANTAGDAEGAFFQTGSPPDEVVYENFPTSEHMITQNELRVDTTCSKPTVPAVSRWGMCVLVLLLLAGVGLKFRQSPSSLASGKFD